MHSDKNRKFGQRHHEAIDQKQALEMLRIFEEVAQEWGSKNGSDHGPFPDELESAMHALRRAISEE